MENYRVPASTRIVHAHLKVADHGVSESISLADLNGNGIELTRDPRDRDALLRDAFD